MGIPRNTQHVARCIYRTKKEEFMQQMMQMREERSAGRGKKRSKRAAAEARSFYMFVATLAVGIFGTSALSAAVGAGNLVHQLRWL